jgi:hypothetical protein
MGPEASSDDHGARFPAGPVEVARLWLRHIVAERDVGAAWRLTAPDYRLALAQGIIFLNEGSDLLEGYAPDDLARQLAIEKPDHSLWPSFANLLVEEWLQDLGEIELEGAQEPLRRATAPGYELVLFVPGGRGDAEEPVEMRSHGVLMQLHGDRWLVAGLSERPAMPGWPPDLGY